jgi:hypothetical protein
MASAFITTWKKNEMYKNDCGILIFLFVTSYSTMFSWVFKCFQYEGLSIYKGKKKYSHVYNENVEVLLY